MLLSGSVHSVMDEYDTLFDLRPWADLPHRRISKDPTKGEKVAYNDGVGNSETARRTT